MVQGGGYGGVLDTPRTNIGDATYLSRVPDFADISQEASFQSPRKESRDILHQLRNGRSNGINLSTPRRDPKFDRNNLPPSVGGAEFTPLLKSATRNSAYRRSDKENGLRSLSPNLDRIDEDDLTPAPRMDESISSLRNQSYLHNNISQIDSSSVTSTPTSLAARHDSDKELLQNGNQLSLRAQEKGVDKLLKENFNLKLKISFLEQQLRKAGPGFNEAALRENTELKVEKVTMQMKINRYKKMLAVTETDRDMCRQQITQLQANTSHGRQDDNLRAEIKKFEKTLDEKNQEIQELRSQLAKSQENQDELEKLRDAIEDLEADVRDKDGQLTEREDEVEDLKDKVEEAEKKARDAEQRALEADENGKNSDQLEEAKETIEDLEHNIRRLEEQVDELNEKLEEAANQKDRAEQNLEELQEEMADKSVVPKGLSRQLDEKVGRLQDELEKTGEEYAALEKEYTEANREIDQLKAKLDRLESDQERLRRGKPESDARISELEEELQAQVDERDVLQTRYDSLVADSSARQIEFERLQREVDELEANVAKEREYVVEVEKDLRDQYQDEIERLNDEHSLMQAEIREKDNLYDNDSEKWETEKKTLEAERNRAEEKADGLQRTIDRLREAEGSLSDRGSKLQESLRLEKERHRSEEAGLAQQIDDLQETLETRQKKLSDLRNELSTVRDDLRKTQIDYQTQANKVASLQDQLESMRNQPAISTTPARRESEALRRECASLKEQLQDLREKADKYRALAEKSPARASQTPTRLKSQLSDANAKLDKVSSEKRSLQDDLASVRAELSRTQTSLAEANAERDELDSQLRRMELHNKDALRTDQESLDLRSAKLKLDNEVRRLREENKTLSEQRQSLEKSLEDEIEKAAADEDRLSHEIFQLEAKLRQASSAETTDKSTTRRTIRDLERRVENYQAQLASAQALLEEDDSGELSIIRRDLTTARQKELDLMQREATNKDVIKNLRREVANLEQKLHDDQQGMKASPNVSQMANATYGGSHIETEALQQQLDDAEDQRVILEEFLEEARQQAEETAAEHAQSLERLQHQLDRAIRDRDAAAEAAAAASAVASSSSPSARGKESREGRQLRKMQAEVESLLKRVDQQQTMIDNMTASEAGLRRKLERARSERAAYKMSAEKLHKDMASRDDGAGAVEAEAEAEKALETVVRAADAAKERHEKELRGMMMMTSYMKARWEREAMLRADVAFAKNFVQLQLDVATACNKAKLRELEHIRVDILGCRKPLVLSNGKTASSSDGGGGSGSGGKSGKKPTLRRFLIMARFVARTRILARGWAEQEVVRDGLVEAIEETKKARKRSRRMKIVRVEEVTE